MLEGGSSDREPLLAAILQSLRERLVQWRAGDGALESDYREACVTIGRMVEVGLPDGSTVRGWSRASTTTGIFGSATARSESTVTAGDVIHATI